MRTMAVWLAVLGVCAAAARAEGPAAATDQPGGGQPGAPILAGHSVWRGYVVWQRPKYRTEAGLVAKRVYGSMKQESDPPREEWTWPRFDDRSWFRWRRIRPDYYGFGESVNYGRLCLRGKFTATDPRQVYKLTLSLVYRGGVAAYLNGAPIGRGHLAGGKGILPPDALADDYPAEAFDIPSNRVEGNADLKRRAELRVRRTELDVPVSMLRDGLNVLALDVRAAPLSNGQDASWSTCDLIGVELRSQGDGLMPNVATPRGVHVWSADSLTRVFPYGTSFGARIFAGAGATFEMPPLTWSDPHEPLAPIRIVGARNGVFCGQAVVTCDQPIRNLSAEMSDLARADGEGRIAASACEVRYVAFPTGGPKDQVDAPLGMIDALLESPVEFAPARTANPVPGNWADGGAVQPVWVKVRVPADAAPGEYRGTLTIRLHADDKAVPPLQVPLSLSVSPYRLPAPADLFTHLGLMESPETLAVQYGVEPFSDAHFKLIERSYAYMGELGGNVLMLPIALNGWLGNARSYVYWVKGPDGGWTYDFRLFDRYVDMALRHIRPDAVVVYVLKIAPGKDWRGAVSQLDPATGKLSDLPTPEPTAPEAQGFYRPMLAAVRERLAKRGLGDAMVIGLVGDRWPAKEVIDGLADAAPGVPWFQIAHYGGQKGGVYDRPYGYVMSIWGQQTKTVKAWGGTDAKFKTDLNLRAYAYCDSRPYMPRAGLRYAPEYALAGRCSGLAPLGMDFWPVPVGEGDRRRMRILESGYGASVVNLTMSPFSASALLAPGPDGPVATARFDVLREGVQECEARTVIVQALADEGRRAALGRKLVEQCESLLAERDRMFAVVRSAERAGQGQGWLWYQTTDWQDRSRDLFDTAAAVVQATAVPDGGRASLRDGG